MRISSERYQNKQSSPTSNFTGKGKPKKHSKFQLNRSKKRFDRNFVENTGKQNIKQPARESKWFSWRNNHAWQQTRQPVNRLKSCDKPYGQSYEQYRSHSVHYEEHEEALYLELTGNTNYSVDVFKREISGVFGEILAGFSLRMLYLLRLDGLLFVLQLVAFSLIVQWYVPILSRYYFEQSARVLLLPAENQLDLLLSEDMMLTRLDSQAALVRKRTAPTNASESKIDIASTSFSTNNLIASQQLDPAQLKRILHPAYHTREYIVQSGENISLLAQRYSLNMSTLISVNQIKRAKSLQAGQKILIPNIDGLMYQVQANDSLASIAAEFDSSIGALIDANQLEDSVLIAGNPIFIPGATLSSYELRKVFGNLYIYPYIGPISSHFGYRNNPFGYRSRREFHNGLDIVGPYGAAVKASSDGLVISAGYQSIYGKYVILQHDKGIKTLYGHMSKLLVSKGQRIFQGHTIGHIGSSGLSTGTHIHFTIFVAGKAVNPIDYLSGP